MADKESIVLNSPMGKEEIQGLVNKEGVYTSRKPGFNPQNEQEESKREEEDRGRKKKRKRIK